MTYRKDDYVLEYISSSIKQIIKGKAGKPSTNVFKERIIPRDAHSLSRSQLSQNSLKVLYRLRDAGYQSYLVGGGVRDGLLGKKPKDFDIATDASPEQVRQLFRNCRLIGRRFRLAHILFGRDIIEVATFRANHDAGDGGSVSDDGRILRDNVYGTIEEDAVRRDFTVNALYYNIDGFSIVDYVDGLSDLNKKVLRLIGDPETRYAEDPVRILRAVRFAAKLDFTIAPETAEPIEKMATMLEDIPPARLFEEVVKLFQSGHGEASFRLLREYDLLQYLLPAADEVLKEGDSFYEKLFIASLINTDKRIVAGKPVTPAFLFAVFLWPDVWRGAQEYESNGEPPVPAIQAASADALQEQALFTAIPKRFSFAMREIWSLQPRLCHYQGRRALRLLEHERFRAGYDFLCLRAQIEPELETVAKWWTEIQEQAPEKQMATARKSASSDVRRRRRRRPRKRSPSSQPGA